MKCRSISFDSLPFSELFRSYVGRAGGLESFYDDHPFSEEAVQRRAAEFRFPGDRGNSCRALERFNHSFGAGEKTLRQLDRLKQPDSLVVVTGQQLTLYGGPLFTIYKTLTTILYARRWETLLKRPVIPVFWLADEDHDYEEAAEVGLLVDEVFRSIRLDSGTGFPVGREKLSADWKRFHDELVALLPASDFNPAIRALIERHYREGATFREAFGGLLLELFGKHGLLLAGSDDPEIKSLVSRPMADAAGHPEELFRALEEQSRRVDESGFVRQALVQPSNLFYIHPESGRRKLECDQGVWSDGNGRLWSPEELQREVEEHPDRFSPNVFLRPILQDRLLPVLAYVCGPGELSYYAQMKRAYDWAGQRMPLLLPRFSATLIEPAVSRIMSKLPIRFEEFQKRTEDLEALFLQRTDRDGLDELFDHWKDGSRKLTDEGKRRVCEVDPTLEAAADRVGTLFEKELDRLRKKVNRSVKRQHRIEIDRIHRIREHLAPGGKLQERQLSFLYYMNRYGPDIWDRLLEQFEEQAPDTHKVIEL